MAGGKAGGGPAAVAQGGNFAGLPGVTPPLTGLGTGGVPLAIPPATAAQAGYMSAAQAAQLAANTGQGWIPRTIARAVSKALLSDENMAVVTFEAGGLNFAAAYTDNWFQVTAAGGTPDYGSANGDRGGYLRLRRATAAGTMHYQRSCSGFLEGGGATGKKYYMRFRAKWGSLVGAGAAIIQALGFSNDAAHASFIDAGIVAANSTAKFSARLTGTTTVNLTSNVNVDTTNYHWLELYSDGTNTFISVDDEAPVSGAYVAFTPSLKPNICYVSDGTAGVRDMFLDRAFWAVEQPT